MHDLPFVDLPDFSPDLEAKMSLFGSSATAGRTSSKNLVEFRAGKMHLKGTTVTPDKRKGLLYLYQSDDSLMHFCWKDRTSGNVEDVSLHELDQALIVTFFYRKCLKYF